MERRAFLGSGGAAALGLALSPTSALAQRTRRAAAGSPDAALSARLDAIFAEYVKRSPELATNLGLDKGANAPLKSELTDVSRRGALADLAANRRWLAEVQAFPPPGCRKPVGSTARLSLTCSTKMSRMPGASTSSRRVRPTR